METTINTNFDQYLINAINTEGYEVNASTDAEKLQFLYNIFIDEQGYKIPQMRGNKIKAFEDTIQGAPSWLNIEHFYTDITNIGYLFNLIKADATQEEEETFQLNWYKLISKRFFTLFNNYNINQ
jgi:hypothetical protein